MSVRNKIKSVTPDETSVSTIRPRFKVDVPYSARELEDKILDGLKRIDAPCKGRVIEGHALLYLPEEDQHYWSPQLTLSFEEGDGYHFLRGLYGPRPAVWTMFIFFYALVGFAAVVVGMVGLTYLSLDKSASILWLVPILLLLFLTIYLVANYGKKMGHKQMVILHDFLKDFTGLKL